ncbi:MAG: DNA repair protein RecO [Actinomycetota bacterium]|nr:MAG: DNA repair protein RecO [Actinomycetota bacterium]
MSTFKARAIIIKTYKLGEADKIIKMYSQEGCLISAVAKGSRKIRSRFRGRLELFNMVDLELSRGRNLDVINQVEIYHSFLKIPRDFNKFVFAEIISNIILKTQASGDGTSLLFKLLYVCLNEINNAAEEDDVALKKIMCFFDVRFLQIMGFSPMMDQCSRCNESLGGLYGLGKTSICFSIKYGGILCNECSGLTGSKTVLNPSSYRLISDLLKLKMEDFRDIEVNPGDLKRVYKLIENYIVFHTGCTVDSFKYLKKIGL